MTADKMFEELGYKKDELSTLYGYDNKTLEELGWERTNLNETIEFNQENRLIVIDLKRHILFCENSMDYYQSSEFLTPAEIKAIYQLYKELRWIE